MPKGRAIWEPAEIESKAPVLVHHPDEYETRLRETGRPEVEKVDLAPYIPKVEEVASLHSRDPAPSVG